MVWYCDDAKDLLLSDVRWPVWLPRRCRSSRRWCPRLSRLTVESVDDGPDLLLLCFRLLVIRLVAVIDERCGTAKLAFVAITVD